MLCPRCQGPLRAHGRRTAPARRDAGRRRGVTALPARRLRLLRQSGYRGRTGVFEILELDEALRRLITDVRAGVGDPPRGRRGRHDPDRRGRPREGPRGGDEPRGAPAGRVLRGRSRAASARRAAARCPRSSSSARTVGEPVGSCLVRCQRRLDAGWQGLPLLRPPPRRDPRRGSFGEASGPSPRLERRRRDAEVEPPRSAARPSALLDRFPP